MACDVYVTAGSTIQSGVDAASAGQTVCVGPGSYGCSAGWAATISKDLKVIGTDGASATIIDCGGFGGGFYASLLDTVTVQGFTFRDAAGMSAGGVHAVDVLNVTVSECAFSSCQGSIAGAIACWRHKSWR